ncbi:BolA family transcriptional regulator [Nereida sp. MMG025]|uniref:BolA family protein n=1 Tax=Nereida sp. MMG025 TaxID=2909981 RepID=UPI001F31D77F|nr:BolA family protein [Nereida sp. MMG025]MCF6445249.1 BolA family transcriptional regulator [Nereida sp. MMG025]
MSRKKRMEERLTEALAPSVLEIVDESESHRGHAGFQEGGESHFRLVIESAALTGTRIAKHRAIHAAIGKDLMAEIHALAIEIR